MQVMVNLHNLTGYISSRNRLPLNNPIKIEITRNKNQFHNVKKIIVLNCTFVVESYSVKKVKNVNKLVDIKISLEVVLFLVFPFRSRFIFLLNIGF